MKQLKSIRTIISGIALSIAVIGSSAATAFAAPAPSQATRPSVSGPQAKAPIEPGSRDAKLTDQLGSTNLIKTNNQGKPDASNNLSVQSGSVSGVDFGSFYNYCWKNLVYTPVTNTTGSTQYLHILVWNQGMYRDLYTSVAAGSTVYPAFYGVDGAYSAYLYVWNGSSYQYDEYSGNTNTCNVSVTRTYNAGGWVQLKIQNLGTAYATQISTELAPYPGSGTYTGTQYDYPVAGGAAIYRWFNVGTDPYGINSYTYGSFNMPYFFTGDL